MRSESRVESVGKVGISPEMVFLLPMALNVSADARMDICHSVSFRRPTHVPLPIPSTHPKIRTPIT